MSDPGYLTAKMAAVHAAISDYLTELPDVVYLGVHVKVKDHVTDDQISELSALVVDAVDTCEDDWAKAHPAKP